MVVFVFVEEGDDGKNEKSSFLFFFLSCKKEDFSEFDDRNALPFLFLFMDSFVGQKSRESQCK